MLSSLVLVAILMWTQAKGVLVPAPPVRKEEKKSFVFPFKAMPQPPTLPKIDLNSCPGEGCQFGKWTARKRVTVYSTWRTTRKVILTLQQGEEVTALTGVNIVLQPGKGIFSRDVPMFGARKGDLAYMYTYCGEGAQDMWVHGRFMGCVDPNFSWKPGRGCRQDCNGRYLALAKSEWWARIRFKDGRTGWVRAADNFDGTDALA